MQTYEVKLTYTVVVTKEVGAVGSNNLDSKIEDLIALPLADQIADDNYTINLEAVDTEEVL